MGGPPSVLLDPDRFRFRASGGVFDLHLHLLDDLGALKPEWLEPEVFRSMEKNLRFDPDVCATWKRAMAEELLLMAAEGHTVNRDMLEMFGGVCPFNDGPVLQECLGKPAAVGVFPTTGKESCGIGHVWVIEGLDYRDPMTAEGGEDFQQGLAIATSHSSVSGQSWQLAANLAIRALEANDAEGKLRRELARNWIATGTVDERQLVGRVELGNKLSLQTERNWLLPRDNYGDISPAVGNRRIRFAPDVDSARAVVSGEGIRRGEYGNDWPGQVEAIHVLIGGDIKAALASILYSPVEAPVHLWCSGNEQYSVVPAKALKEILCWLRPKTVVKPPHELSSADMVSAEQSLRRHFQNQWPPPETSILFNVTSGNRLMSYAVQSIALQIPNLKLIYRDIDDTEEHRYSMLDYSERPVTTVKIMGPQSARDLLAPESWKWLFSRIPMKRTAEEIVKEFQEQLVPATPRHGP